MAKIIIVMFRESLEISILFGIILAVTKLIKNSRICLTIGSITGFLLSLIFAIFIKYINTILDGTADDLLNILLIFTTITMISWTIIWVQNYSQKLKKSIEKISVKFNDGISNKIALITLVTLTIFREGVEIVLFIHSIISVGKISLIDSVIGIATGSFAGLSLGLILYFGLIKFTPKWIFKISTLLLVLIAASLASDAAQILISSGIIDSVSVFSIQLWDSSSIISDQSILGRILNILAGYNAKPNLMQLIFYMTTICFNVILLNIKSYAQRKNS